MGKIIKDTLHAAGVDIGIYTQDFENEFISLTDIARYKSDDPTAVIQNWMRNRDVIEFLGLWERLHNPDFKPLEFEGFRKQAGANAFTMSPKKWIEATDAIGIVSKAGRYGGTYAHQLLVLANLESYNAVLINQGKNQKERMELLRQLAVQQLQTLEMISLNNFPKIEEKQTEF